MSNSNHTSPKTVVKKVPPQNRLADLCGIALPVFQAGMAGIAGPELVAAVSEAGGLGHLGGLRQPPSALRAAIREVKRHTDRPFGVNLVPAYGGPEVFEAQVQVVLDEKPKVLSLFYGDYPKVIRRAREAGIVVMAQVGSLGEARKVVGEGADVIIAQGVEAGGHVRGTVGLLPLLSSVMDLAEGRPVLAAGGVVHEADVRAVLALGAEGVWVRTAFVATHESNAHEIYKERLIEASTDDPEYRTGYSFGWKYGTPHRIIPGEGRFNLLRFVGGGARANDKPVMARKLSLYAGQGVGRITEILPATEIVARLAKGFDVPKRPSRRHLRDHSL